MIWYLLGGGVVGVIFGYILGIVLEKRAAEKVVNELYETIDRLEEELVDARVQISALRTSNEIDRRRLLENRRDVGDIFIDPREDSPGQLW